MSRVIAVERYTEFNFIFFEQFTRFNGNNNYACLKGSDFQPAESS